MNDVDWSQAPAWANWWTQDRHGTCWFEAEPEYGFGSWHTPDKAATSRYATIAHDGGPVVAIMRRDAGAAPPAPQGEKIGRKEIENRAEGDSGLSPISSLLSPISFRRRGGGGVREVIAQDGKHYRLRATDATVIEIQSGHGQRWRLFAEYNTREETRWRLAQLGNLRPSQTEEIGQKEIENRAEDNSGLSPISSILSPSAGETRYARTEYTETCTLCSGSGHHRTGLLCPACMGTGIMRVVGWMPQGEEIGQKEIADRAEGDSGLSPISSILSPSAGEDAP